MKTAVLHPLLFALALVVCVPSADAARADYRNRKQNKEQQAAAEGNEYPNAKREEPKPGRSTSAYDSLKKGYDLLEKDPAKARAALEAVVANGKASKMEQAQAYRALVQLDLDEDKTAEALQHAQRAVDLDALDNKTHFETLYLIAQININEEKYEDALVAIDRWFAITGSDKAEAHALKGNALYRLERYPQAAESLKKAIATADEPQDAWQQMLTATYQESGDTQGAIQAAEAVLQKDPGNKQATLQLAQAYVDAEQTDKAAALLDSAYQKGTLDDEKALVYLSNLYHEMENSAKAAEVLAGAIAAGKVKGDETNYTRLGNYFYEAEKIDEAIDAYGKGAALSTSGELDYQRGYLLLQEKEDLVEGKKAILAGLAKGNLKQEGQAHHMLGNAYHEEGNCKAAKAEYLKARAFPATQGMADTMLKQLGC
jgi:predicted Zn-dependent protease